MEVLYTLLRLKITNPEKVFLVRGNHEEVGLQSRYGFLEEGRYKYGAKFNADKLERAYDFFPVVIYAGTGTNFIQCNHGGMEPAFNPQSLLGFGGPTAFQFLGRLNQKTFLADHPGWLPKGDGSRAVATENFLNYIPQDPGAFPLIGFMWNDFTVFTNQPQLADDPDRGLIFGAQSTRFLLQAVSGRNGSIHAVFRGHQQSLDLNPMMRRLIASRGVFRHWQANDSLALQDAPIDDLSRILEHDELRLIPSGSVWTFNVSPDSLYGERCNYSFDAFGLLKLASNPSDWRLRVVNIEVGR